MATPFSAFASTSGLAASPSTTVASGSGFGSYSVASASPFSSVKTSTEVGGLSRKLGEPVEVDAGKRVFTEQEGAFSQLYHEERLWLMIAMQW